jgi:hypothetical protein
VSFFDLIQGEHGILFTVSKIGQLIAIKQGFTSGYWGEGPRRLAFVLALLEEHKIPIEEYEVDRGFIDRLDKCALTKEDIEKLNSTEPRRWPPWTNYVDVLAYDARKSARTGTVWEKFPEIIPFGIIDSRIMDLARTFGKIPPPEFIQGTRDWKTLLENGAV